MRKLARHGVLVAAFVGLAATCSSIQPQSHEAPVPPDRTGSEGHTDVVVSAGDQPRPEVEIIETVRLDLLDGHRRAEQLVSRGPFCDLGTPRQHRCTLGGFRSGWGDVGTEDEITFAVAKRRTVKLHFQLDEPRDSTLHVRLNPGRGSNIEVRAQGSSVGSVALTPNQWQQVAIPIPETQLRRGNNELTIGLRGSSRARFDWASLQPGLSPSPDIEWSPPSSGDDADDEIHLSEGTGLAFSFHAPPRGRVALTVVGGEQPVNLSIQALTDARRGESVLELASTEITPGERRSISAPLEVVEGHVVRLEIRCASRSARGSLRLVEAQIRQQVDESNDLPRDDIGTATNLVIILIDTLRPDHLTTYNPSTRVRSSFFESFAQSGVVFSAAQAQENWTKPSVATLLTSLYPSSHNAKSGEAVLPDEVEMLGEILQHHGFVTAAFIANGYVSGRFGFEQGWDDYRNYVREGIRNRADRVVDDTIEWLEKRPQGQPFFLYVHTIDPHVPYSPPRRFRELYDPDTYRGPIVASRTAQLLGDIKVGRLEPTARDRFRLEALYDGEITYHDEHFGRLVDALDQEGLLEETLIWVTSDHGEEFFDHGSVGHGHSLYQELLHVPLIASLPGTVPSGIHVAGDVGLIDVLPTSLDLLGLPAHPDAQGHSINGLIQGDDAPVDGASFSEFLGGGRAVRSHDDKLVIQGSTFRLFDLSTDPGEQQDLSIDRPITLGHMMSLLSTYIGETEGPDLHRAGGRRRPVHERQESPLDAETAAQLRALGYLE